MPAAGKLPADKGDKLRIGCSGEVGGQHGGCQEEQNARKLSQQAGYPCQQFAGQVADQGQPFLREVFQRAVQPLPDFQWTGVVESTIACFEIIQQIREPLEQLRQVVQTCDCLAEKLSQKGVHAHGDSKKQQCCEGSCGEIPAKSQPFAAFLHPWFH